MYFYKRQELLFLLLMNAEKFVWMKKTCQPSLPTVWKGNFTVSSDFKIKEIDRIYMMWTIFGHFVCTPLLFFFVQNYLFFKIKRRVHIFIFFDKVVSFLFECLSQWLQYYKSTYQCGQCFQIMRLTCQKFDEHRAAWVEGKALIRSRQQECNQTIKSLNTASPFPHGKPWKPF